MDNDKIYATIHEGSMGFPEQDEYVQGDGRLYRVTRVNDRVAIHGPGIASSIEVELEPADYDDCPEGDVVDSRVEIHD